MSVIPYLAVILATEGNWAVDLAGRLIDQLAPTIGALAALLAAWASWSARHKAKQAEQNTRKIGNGFADSVLSGQEDTHKRLGIIERVLGRVGEQARAAADRSDLAAERVDEVVGHVTDVRRRLDEHIAAQDGRVRERPREPGSTSPDG